MNRDGEVETLTTATAAATIAQRLKEHEVDADSTSSLSAEL